MLERTLKIISSQSPLPWARTPPTKEHDHGALQLNMDTLLVHVLDMVQDNQV